MAAKLTFLEETRTRQPSYAVRVDWSNPISRGLLVAATPHSQMAVQGTRFYGSFGVSVKGATLNAPYIKHGVANSTVLVIDTFVSADGGGWYTANDSVYADTSEEWPNDKGIKVLSSKSYGQVSIGSRNTAGDMVFANIDVFPGNLAVGSAPLVRVCTIDGNLLLTGWGNGINYGTSTGIQGFTYDPPSAGNVLFGCVQLNDTVTAQALVLRWGRVLSDAEIVSISANPWQIFEPEEIPLFKPVVTAQFARPTSDVSAGGWTASTGSDLFAMLDESSANDSDYITTTSASVCEVALGSLNDPAVSTGHIVRYRISATGGGIIVRLREGTTTIASWTHDPAPASLTTYAQTLSGGETDSITNYGALKLQFEAT